VCERPWSLIYIEPPYNTRESFIYDDSFSVPESQYLRATGQLDEQGNAMSTCLETAGRKHGEFNRSMKNRF
jgi:adenine-specific DNA-methyltransferase